MLGLFLKQIKKEMCLVNKCLVIICLTNINAVKMQQFIRILNYTILISTVFYMYILEDRSGP